MKQPVHSSIEYAPENTTAEMLSSAARLAGVVFCALAFLTPVVAVPLPRALAYLMPLATLFCLPLLWRRRKRIALRQALLPFLLGATLLTNGLLASPVPDRALMFGLTGYLLVLVGWLLYQAALMLTEPQKRSFFKSLLVGEIVAAAMIVAEYLLKQPVTGALSQWWGDPIPHLYAIDRGIIVVSLLCWPLAGFFRLSGPLVIALAALVSWRLDHTSSQAATVALPIGAACYCMAMYWPVLTRRLISVGALMAFLAAPLVIFLLVIIFRGDDVIWSAANAGTRLGIWNMTTGNILAHPWLGHGIEAAVTLPQTDGSLHPHNGILQIWLEFGLIGILLATTAVLFWIHTTKNRPALQAAFVSWLAIFCVSYDIWQPWWISTAVLLLIFTRLAPARS